MGLSKFFLNTGEALRPVLTKIIPMKLLSKMKAGIINNATDKLSADSIEKYEAGRYKCGANIIGNIKGDNGLGQSARIMCRLLDDMVKGGFLSKENQVLEVGLNEELVSLFSRALEIAEADKISSQQYLAGIVLHMIGMILSISKNKIFEVGDVDQKIEQAKIIMNENVFKDVDPEELAMKLNISYSWFRKVFKDYTGYAPAKYFQELKLRKAKQLLVGTSLSVKEISFMLDYKSTEHFFSSFKKRTGFTPLEYRSYGRETGGEEV